MDSRTVRTDANFFGMDRQTIRTNANFFKRFYKSVRKNNEWITNAYPLETDNRHKCVRIKPFRLNENSAWTVIPNEATSHLGGFSFLSKCNCSRKDINIKELPLFYIRTLQYWFEFNTKPCTRNTIIWNNKDIKIDNITIFFRTRLIRGASTIENLLDPNLDLDFLTYEDKNTLFDLLQGNKRYRKVTFVG